MQCAAFLNLPQRDVIEGRPSTAPLSTTRPQVFGERGARRRTRIYILAPGLDVHRRDLMETGKNRVLVISLLFSIKRSYVILSLEHWRKVFLFPSGSNYSQPPVFQGLRRIRHGALPSVLVCRRQRIYARDGLPRHGRRFGGRVATTRMGVVLRQRPR